MLVLRTSNLSLKNLSNAFGDSAQKSKFNIVKWLIFEGTKCQEALMLPKELTHINYSSSARLSELLQI